VAQAFTLCSQGFYVGYYAAIYPHLPLFLVKSEGRTKE